MDKTLSIWFIITSNENEVLNYLNEKFGKFEEVNHLKIHLKIITWNRAFSALIKAYKNDNAPDVVQIGTTWINTLAYMGYIDRVPMGFPVRESFAENMNSVCKYQGDLYAIPWIIESIIFAARQDYMELYGIDAEDLNSWEKFYQACQSIEMARREKSNLPKPFAFSLRAEADTLHRFFAILWSKGYSFPDLYQRPEHILTGEGVLENISYLAGLMQVSGISTADLEKHPYQLNDEFYLNGEYVFYMGSWYGIVEDICTEPIISSQGLSNYKILRYPESGEVISRSYGGGSVLAVSAGSRYRQESWKLVEYLISDDFINGWISASGKVPAFEVDFWQLRHSDERLKIMYEQTLKASTYPSYPAWSTIESIMSKGVAESIWQLIEKGLQEIDQETYLLLDKTDQSIRELLKMSWEMRHDG